MELPQVHFNKGSENVHFHKIVLSFLEFTRQFNSKDQVLEALSDEVILKSLDISQLGEKLYLDLRSEKLLHPCGSVLTLRDRSSHLIQFGLKQNFIQDFQTDMPAYSPKLFNLDLDLRRLEGALNTRLEFYAITSYIHNNKKHYRKFKLRQETCRDSFADDSEPAYKSPDIYEILLSLEPDQNGTLKLAFSVLLQTCGYNPIIDERLLMNRVHYARGGKLMYHFDKKIKCHLKDFQDNFLLPVLRKYVASEAVSEFQRCKNKIQEEHICEKEFKKCNTILSLDFNLNEMMANFPLSFSLVCYLGEKWLYSSNVTSNYIKSKKRNYLDPCRKQLSRSRIKFETFFRYNPPREAIETEDQHLKIKSSPAKVNVICATDGLIYLAEDDISAEILKESINTHRSHITGSECQNVKTLKVFLQNLASNLTKEKLDMRGETGFCSDKDKNNFREELKKQIFNTDDKFDEHCSACKTIPKTMRTVKAGGRQKLYKSEMTVTSYLKVFGMNTSDNIEKVRTASSWCCASYDGESIQLQNEDDISMCRRSSLINKSYGGGISNPKSVPQDMVGISPQLKLFTQQPIFLGASDIYLQEVENRDPEIFEWDIPLRSYPQAAILKMVECFMGFAMKRQMQLFNAKFQLLNKLFSFLNKYHLAVVEFYMNEKNISWNDIFPPELCCNEDLDPILSPLEELFLAPNLSRLMGSIKKKAKMACNLESSIQSQTSNNNFVADHEVSESAEFNEDEPGLFDDDIKSDTSEFTENFSEDSDEEELSCDQDQKFYSRLCNPKMKKDDDIKTEDKNSAPLIVKANKACEHLIKIKKLWRFNILGEFEKSLLNLCSRLTYFCLNMQAYDGVIIHTYAVTISQSGYIFTRNPNKFGPNGNLRDKRTLQDLTEVFGNIERNESGQIPLSIRLAYYLTGRLNKRLQVQRNGLKVNRITISPNCTLTEAGLLMSPGQSLSQLQKLTKGQTVKGSFCFQKLTNLPFLDQTSLPSDIESWKTDLGNLAPLLSDLEILKSGSGIEYQEALKREQTRINLIKQERDRAIFDFNRLKCKTIKEYFVHYLKSDVEILLNAMNTLRKQFREILDLDFLETGHKTLSSYAFACIQHNLVESKRPAFCVLDQAMSHAIVRSSFIGGILQVSRTMGGANVESSNFTQLNNSMKQWSKKHGFNIRKNKEKRLVKRRIQSRKREIFKSYKKREHDCANYRPPKKKSRLMSDKTVRKYTQAVLDSNSSGNDSEGDSRVFPENKMSSRVNAVRKHKKKIKRLRGYKHKLLSINGHLEHEIIRNQSRILNDNLPSNGGFGSVYPLKRGPDTNEEVMDTSSKSYNDSISSQRDQENPQWDSQEKIYFMEKDSLQKLRQQTPHKSSHESSVINSYDINSLYGTV